MTVGKGSKQAKGGASKGTVAASKKGAQPSKTEGKKAGTRFGTIVNVRSTAKKGGGGGSRNKLRDGT